MWTPTSLPPRSRGPLRPATAVALALLVVGLALPPASATPTDPALALTRALAAAGSSGSRIARLEGVLPGEDLVQVGFPLQVLIWLPADGRYVRYDLSGGVAEGVAPELADGLDGAEAAALLSAGAPSPDADVLLVDRYRIDVRLPASLPGGAAQAQLFVVDAGGAVLSNPISVLVPGLPS